MLAKLSILLMLFVVGSTSAANALAAADDSQVPASLRMLETLLIALAVYLYARGVVESLEKLDRIASCLDRKLWLSELRSAYSWLFSHRRSMKSPMHSFQRIWRSISC